MKKICFLFILLAALTCAGYAAADEELAFGVNPPMDGTTAGEPGSTARELIEKGLIPQEIPGTGMSRLVPVGGATYVGNGPTAPSAPVPVPQKPNF